LLNFLMPTIFHSWEQFDSWFDFSGLEDEESTEEFLQDKMQQDLVKKIHLILQPMLLRRIKRDVEHLLPQKREYILYAPMTNVQTGLYNAITDSSVDTRKYLEDKVVERLTSTSSKPAQSGKSNMVIKIEEASDSEDDTPLSQLVTPSRGRGRPRNSGPPKNAFEQMMQKKKPVSLPTRKRKSAAAPTPPSKSAKSSKESTPASSIRDRKVRKRKSYTEAHSSDEDALDDDEFENKLAAEMAKTEENNDSNMNEEDSSRANILELASRFPNTTITSCY